MQLAILYVHWGQGIHVCNEIFWYVNFHSRGKFVKNGYLLCVYTLGWCNLICYSKLARIHKSLIYSNRTIIIHNMWENLPIMHYSLYLEISV